MFTQVDTPVIAAKHAGKAFIVEFALIFHANLPSDRVGGHISDCGIRMNISGIRFM
jgi:hypothetical protein